jgi:hypothetical protein
VRSKSLCQSSPTASASLSTAGQRIERLRTHQRRSTGGNGGGDVRAGCGTCGPIMYDFTAHCKRRWVGEPRARRGGERVCRPVARRLSSAPLRSAACSSTARRSTPRTERSRRRRAASSRAPPRGASVGRVHCASFALTMPPPTTTTVSSSPSTSPPSIPVHPGRSLSPPRAHVSPGARAAICDVSSFRIASIVSLPASCSSAPRPTLPARHHAASLSDGATRKCYLALVRGHFAHAHAAAFVRVDVPIVVRGGYQGVCSTGADGKRAITYVRALAYDAARDLSVVLCVPVTGRTHQIRVHLQHLGFPIANDPLYGAVAAAADNEKRGPILSDGKTKRAWQRDSFDASRAAKSSRDSMTMTTTTTTTTMQLLSAAPTNRSSPFASRYL